MSGGRRRDEGAVVEERIRRSSGRGVKKGTPGVVAAEALQRRCGGRGAGAGTNKGTEGVRASVGGTTEARWRRSGEQYAAGEVRKHTRHRRG